MISMLVPAALGSAGLLDAMEVVKVMMQPTGRHRLITSWKRTSESDGILFLVVVNSICFLSICPCEKCTT